MQQALQDNQYSPSRENEKTVDQETTKREVKFRKHSQVAARKQVAMGIYKAPVVKTRYRKVVNHFHAKPKSQAPDEKIKPSELNTNQNSSVIIKKNRYQPSNRT